MITYKYCVYDDDHKIQDSCFDTFEQAFDYAQDGLITHIEEIPVVDGVEQEGEVVWDWDETWDRDEAIARVAHRHDTDAAGALDDYANHLDTTVQDDKDISKITYDTNTDSPSANALNDFYNKLAKEDEAIDEDVEIEIKADRPEELVDLAHCVLGKNCEFFDTDFDEPVPEAEVEIVPVAEEPVELEVEETPETVDPESAFDDGLYPELLKKPEVEVDVTPEDEEPESESEEPESEEKLEDEEVEEDSDEDEEVKESLCEEDDGEYVECIWCLDQVKKCNCVHDRDHGYICKDCLPQVEKEANLHLDTPDDDISDEEFVEAFGQAMIDKHNGEELDEASIFSKIGSGLNKFGKAIKRGVEKHVVSPEVLDKYFSEYKVIKYKKASAGQDDDDSVLVLKEEVVKTYKEATNIAENYSKISSSGIAEIKATKVKDEINFLSDLEMPHLVAIYKDGKDAESHYKEVLNDIYAMEDMNGVKPASQAEAPKEKENGGSESSGTTETTGGEPESAESKPSKPKAVAPKVTGNEKADNYIQLARKLVERPKVESLTEAEGDILRTAGHELNNFLLGLGKNKNKVNLDALFKSYLIRFVPKEKFESPKEASLRDFTAYGEDSEITDIAKATPAYKKLAATYPIVVIVGNPNNQLTTKGVLKDQGLNPTGEVIYAYFNGKLVLDNEKSIWKRIMNAIDMYNGTSNTASVDSGNLDKKKEAAEKADNIKAKREEIKKLDAEVNDLVNQMKKAAAEEDYAKAAELKSVISEKKQTKEKAEQELAELQK